jgi:aldehyde:ferredoxin oxidoreductase
MKKDLIGKILNVDLSARQVRAVELEEMVIYDYLGGLGLGVKILYDEVGPNVGALSPDNVIIIAPGLLSGTSAPTNGRAQIVTKSPLTGILGTGNFGGFWGPRLKLAGFEALVIRDKSDMPVYLWVDDGAAELRSAEHLWGKDTWETTDILRGELGNDVSVLSIGQAGENLVKFACPVIDYYHAPGRSHAGCVMGSKKLKAIAVRGTKKIAIADPERFSEAVKEAIGRIIIHPERKERKESKFGIMKKIGALVRAGVISCKNFQTTSLSPDNELLNLPEAVLPHLAMGKFCYHCPMGYGCDLVANVKTGSYAGLRLGGINCYISYWGGYSGIKSFPASWKCKELCQRYGMDQGGPIPFAMELFQKGILTKEDLDGLELTWGNEKAIFELIRKIAFREGIGDILAEGSARAAKKIGRGAEDSAMVVKGMEMFGKDPRTAPLVNTLGVMTCLRGADENLSTSSIPFSYPAWAKKAGWSTTDYLKWLIDYIDMPDNVKKEIFGEDPSTSILDPHELDGKAFLAKWFGDLVALCNSIGLCVIATNFWPVMGPSHYAKLYNAYTGHQTTAQEIMKVGERIVNLMKVYAIRCGISRQDDVLPARFYREPLTDGPFKGTLLQTDRLNRLLIEYYEKRGWNTETGVPTRGKLVELKLIDVADELSKLGLLGMSD